MPLGIVSIPLSLRSGASYRKVSQPQMAFQLSVLAGLCSAPVRAVACPDLPEPEQIQTAPVGALSELCHTQPVPDAKHLASLLLAVRLQALVLPWFKLLALPP